MRKRYLSSIYINNFFIFVTLESRKRKCKLIINLLIYVSAFGNTEILIRVYTKYQIPKSKGRVSVFRIFNVDEIWFNLKHLEDFGRSVKYIPQIYFKIVKHLYQLGDFLQLKVCKLNSHQAEILKRVELSQKNQQFLCQQMFLFEIQGGLRPMLFHLYL